MRLLTHNTLKNNSAAAKGKGFPLKIVSKKIRVDDANQSSALGDQEQVAFVTSLLPNLDWPSLVKAAQELGIPSLPPVLSQDLAEDTDFLKALFHILMNVHLVEGTLRCPVTGREFVVHNEIPNMVLEEDECERVRY